jgi:hypothetical protein
MALLAFLGRRAAEEEAQAILDCAETQTKLDGTFFWRKKALIIGICFLPRQFFVSREPSEHSSVD